MIFNRAFQDRVSRIPFLGFGLSVDVYSPDLHELMSALDHHGLQCDYVEIFRASQQALETIRTQFPSIVMNYHAEGLWVSQPDWETAYPVKEELDITADHLQVLRSYWLNQECASKQMAGYSFGTYLPPLFTEDSAVVTAMNTRSLQRGLDARLGPIMDQPPLLLLETPPLTYFGFGDVTYPRFFHCLAESSSCGLVLDIGHIWTVFRYSGAWRDHSIHEFLETLLLTFPLERVVQIHLAGLACHLSIPDNISRGQTEMGNMMTLDDSSPPPDWIDCHGSPIPEVLWDMLDQVLKRPELINLKGIALEVDTKNIGMIVEEFARFQNQYSWWAKGRTVSMKDAVQVMPSQIPSPRANSERQSHMIRRLVQEYGQYVQAVTGRGEPSHNNLEDDHRHSECQLNKYRQNYLPHEILVWGGELMEMFPHTIQGLEESGVDLSTFITEWFNSPRLIQEPYDFFLLKIDHFVRFVQNVCPQLEKRVSEEAQGLREGYALANDL